MTFQSHENHESRSDSVHRHIFRSHLAYLNQEETPAKLEQRHHLEIKISGFLSMVPHSEKFSFYELSDIISNSIHNNPNFSAYKAGSAFEALEKYATNLISHPWRKEYKTVKLYSGFYKHFVEHQLFGGSALFHLLGYHYANEGILNLDEPVDPDKAARVALDCLTAYVECQIMVQIYERLKSCKCSWQDIYAVRQDYACGIDEAVRILHQLKRSTSEQERQDRWLHSLENGVSKEEKYPYKHDSNNFQKTGILVDVSNSWTNNTSSFQDFENDSMSPQSSLLSDSHLTKTTKIQGNPKHLALGGMPSQVEYQGRKFTSKTDETDSYASGLMDVHPKANYNSFNKSNNCSNLEITDITPNSWKDSWELLNPLQASSYPIRHQSYGNCDREGLKAKWEISMPNVKEACNSHFGHSYPPHPMMSFESPSYPYPIPHDFTNSRQCQCPTCCHHQMSAVSSKYQQKDPSMNLFETGRSYNRVYMKYPGESSDSNPTILNLSLDGHNNQNSKIKNFTSSSAAFPSYQMQIDSLNDITFRSTGQNKLQQTGTKRESYYDNVPSFDSDVAAANFSTNGTSLNSKCDFLANGSAITNSSTIKPKSQKGSIGTELGNSITLKNPHRKNITNCLPISASNLPSDSPLPDSKSSKTHFTGTQRDSKGNKKWSCSSCTFYNAPGKSICDMCGRSKNPGPEIAPLVSGGRECPQCTLVNRKDSEDCTACGTNLKDSPTYI